MILRALINQQFPRNFDCITSFEAAPPSNTSALAPCKSVWPSRISLERMSLGLAHIKSVGIGQPGVISFSAMYIDLEPVGSLGVGPNSGSSHASLLFPVMSLINSNILRKQASSLLRIVCHGFSMILPLSRVRLLKKSLASSLGLTTLRAFSRSSRLMGS